MGKLMVSGIRILPLWAVVVFSTLTLCDTALAQQKTVTVVVSANAQWVNTGLTVKKGGHVTILATGLWTPGPGFGIVGPDGSTQPWPDNFLNLADIGVCAFCATTLTPHFAGLIGYIGSAPPPAGSYTSTSILSEAQKVFFVGSNYSGASKSTGTLWLNFNDDAYSNNTGDNAGQVTAIVTLTPTAVAAGIWRTILEFLGSKDFAKFIDLLSPARDILACAIGTFVVVVDFRATGVINPSPEMAEDCAGALQPIIDLLNEHTN